jgi:hypothetical protein
MAGPKRAGILIAILLFVLYAAIMQSNVIHAGSILYDC